MAEKSRISRIVYTEVKNLGNYETARIEAEVLVAEGEKPDAVMARLKRWVKNQLKDDPDE